jgi:predicted RNA binding protein YcfA (HicA-like mRNA interferase family)
MGKLPVISGDQARRSLERAGWVFQRQTGSHQILTKPSYIVTIAIPRHRELPAGTLRRIIRDAGLTVEEFISLLK